MLSTTCGFTYFLYMMTFFLAQPFNLVNVATSVKTPSNRIGASPCNIQMSVLILDAV